MKNTPGRSGLPLDGVNVGTSFARRGSFHLQTNPNNVYVSYKIWVKGSTLTFLPFPRQRSDLGFQPSKGRHKIFWLVGSCIIASSDPFTSIFGFIRSISPLSYYLTELTKPARKSRALASTLRQPETLPDLSLADICVRLGALESRPLSRRPGCASPRPLRTPVQNTGFSS